MSVEQELKELILARYKSLREFALTIDMPYSTLDSVLKRGVNKSNVSNVISICKELNISVDALGEGKIVFKDDISTLAAHKDEIDWTEEELKDIEDFKKYVLSKRKKES